MGLRVAQTSPWRALVAVTSWYFLAGMAQAGAIAAWNPTPYAPQIVLQDDATGKIFHSICNNKGATIFPNDNSTVLAIDEKLPPRRNSRLAGVGWWADEGEWVRDRMNSRLAESKTDVIPSRRQSSIRPTTTP